MRVEPITRQLFTVDEAAEHLQLHPKTIRRLIMQGRLPAKRIGKAYRITRTALNEFAGAAAPAPVETAAEIPRVRQVTVSSIVDVDAISPEDSQRVTTFIMASMNSRRGEPDFPRVDTVYDPARGRLRVMITGNPSLTCDLIRTIGALTDTDRT